MAVATLDGVLTSLRALGEEKLAALDATYAAELAWVRSLLAGSAAAPLAAEEPAADEPQPKAAAHNKAGPEVLSEEVDKVRARVASHTKCSQPP